MGTKISELVAENPATALDGTEQLEMTQGGESVGALASQVRDYVDSNLPARVSTIFTVPTLNALKSETTAPLVVYVTAKTNAAIDADWGGNFYYDSTDTTTANDDALTIVRDDGKRYKRAYIPGEFWLNWWVTGYQTEAAATAAAAQHTEIQAAVTALLTYCSGSKSGRLLCPPLFYKLGASISFVQDAISLCSYEFVGGSSDGRTVFLAEYSRTSADDAVFDVGDGTNSQMAHSFTGIKIACIGSGTIHTRLDPILFSARKTAQSHYDIEFGSCNNMNARFPDGQNLTGVFYSASGGRCIWHKNTDDLLVRQSDGGGPPAAGSQINKQSGTATFGAEDVGLIQYIAAANPRQSLVSANSSSTRNDVQTPVTGTSSYLDASDCGLVFELASITTSSVNVNFTKSGTTSLDASHVNLPVCIRYDADTANAQLFFTSIATVDANGVDGTFADQPPLSTGAGITARMCCPGMAVYNDTGGTSVSDIRFKLLTADGAAVPFVAKDVTTLYITDSKITAISSPTYRRFTQSGMWLEQVVGYFSGEFQDQMVAERVWMGTQTSPFTIFNTRFRLSFDALALRLGGKSSTNEGGLGIMSNVSFSGTAPSADLPANLIYDPFNTTADPGYMLTGPWVPVDHAVNRVYLNNFIYADVNGVMFYPGVGASATLARAGNHALTLTTAGTTNVTLPTTGTLAILGANTFTGVQTFPDGSGASPSILLTDAGINRPAAGNLGLSASALNRIQILAGAMKARSDMALGFTSGNTAAALDSAFSRVSAGIVALGNGTLSDTSGTLRAAALAAGGSDVTITAVNAVSPTSPDRTITITYGGTTYYLHAKTTND